MSRITEQQKDAMRLFLVMLYHTTKDKPTTINIAEQAHAAHVPYYANLASLLTKKGILTRIGSYKQNTYQWTTTTEPNIHMRDALLTALRESNIGSDRMFIAANRTNLAQKGDLVSITSIKESICTLKNNLVTLGFSEKSAIELIQSTIATSIEELKPIHGTFVRNHKPEDV